MKKIAISMALLLSPVLAHASDLPSKASSPKAPAKSALLFDGYVGGDFGQQSTDHSFSGEALDFSFDDSGNTYGVHGSFATIFDEQFGMQIDADYRSATHDMSYDVLIAAVGETSLDVNTPTLAGHVFWRDSSKGLIGAFAQHSTSSNMLLYGDLFSLSMERNYLGLDGQAFFGNATFYGQATVLSSDLASNFFGASVGGDGYALTGEIRYFVDPNIMLALRAGYSDVGFTIAGADEFTSNFDATTSSIGAHAEYRLANHPLSIYADASHDMSEVAFDDFFLNEIVSRDETRFLIGLNVNFGSATLLERDRSGASLKAIEPPHSPLALVDFFD